jgi:hypothetical protein
VILFKETLEFKDAIKLCYSWQAIALQNKIPSPQTWDVAHKLMSKVLTLMVSQCILNQSRRYCLFFDVISTTITMCVMMYNTNSNTNEIMQVCGLIAFDFFA